MTDLEKRAKEYALDNYENCLYDDFPYINDSRAIEKAYLDATKAETALLSQHILDLQKDKGNLTDKVIKLESENEQIKNSDTLCKLIGEQKIKIAELEMTVGTLRTFSNEQATCIERLEKENKVLAQNLEDTEIINKTYEKRFDDLKKENAELKEKYDTCLRENANLKIHVVYVEKKLTKAKELIEDMYNAIPSSHSDYYKDVMERAEQFLNSEVEK